MKEAESGMIRTEHRYMLLGSRWLRSKGSNPER
jgi:hypothetical protein